jgi:ABC-type nitrate/sulfonate/bicarbonate transport system permease component
MIATIGTGLRSLPADKIRLIVAWKATFFQKLIYFQLPSALSYMVVSLKAAIPLALVVTVAADMLTATESGLGRIIMDSLAVFDAPRMYAAILVLGILGYFSSIAANQIEELAIHWNGK